MARLMLEQVAEYCSPAIWQAALISRNTGPENIPHQRYWRGSEQWLGTPVWPLQLCSLHCLSCLDHMLFSRVLLGSLLCGWRALPRDGVKGWRSLLSTTIHDPRSSQVRGILSCLLWEEKACYEWTSEIQWLRVCSGDRPRRWELFKMADLH